MSLIDIFKIKRYKNNVKTLEKELSTLKNEYNNLKDKYTSTYADLIIKSVVCDEFKNKSKSDIFKFVNNLNTDVSFDEKNMPYTNDKEYGKYGKFTAYLAPTGNVIHYKKGCSDAFTEINLFNAPKYRACEKCKSYKLELPINKQQYNNYLSFFERLTLCFKK